MKKIIVIALLLSGCAHKQNLEIKKPEIQEKIVNLPDITYKTNYQLSKNESKIAAEKLANSLEKYGMQWQWQEDQIKFWVNKGALSGVNGFLKLNRTWVVEVEVYNLPAFLHLTPWLVKSKIKEKIYAFFKINI